LIHEPGRLFGDIDQTTIVDGFPHGTSMKSWWLAVAAASLIGLARTASAATSTPSDALRAASDSVLDALKRDDLAAIEARFGKLMRSSMSHDKFAAAVATIKTQAGAFGDCHEPTSYPVGTMSVFSYQCDLSLAPVTINLSWDDQGGLLGLAVYGAQPLPALLPQGVREENLTTGATGWALPGTLLMPSGVKLPPVVLLVPGSGPADRDGTFGPNTVFRDLAIGLAGDGIASLRFDKRGRAFTKRFFEKRTSWTFDDEIVDDAVGALVMLSRRADVGPIFIVGHSEGALLAPRIAARAAKDDGVSVTGVVMLAAPSTPLADLLTHQYEFLAVLPESDITPELLASVRTIRDHVHRLLTNQVKRDEEQVFNPLLMSLDLLHMPDSAWLDIGRYDAAETLLEQPQLPALLTFGGRDFNVPIKEKSLWEERVARRPDTTLLGFPSLNHLLIEGQGPMSPIEYNKRGHVSQALIDAVAIWVNQHAAAHLR
jgi:pimeloyl-ACP methyl ester carboxylesterase